jgi:hypothetical protein
MLEKISFHSYPFSQKLVILEKIYQTHLKNFAKSNSTSANMVQNMKYSKQLMFNLELF